MIEKVFAQQTIVIATPAQGYKDVGVFIGNILTILFAIAVLVVLFMFIYSLVLAGSAGDKEGAGKARGAIINALVGLAVLAVAFALAVVAANFLGFDNITQLIIPGPR